MEPETKPEQLEEEAHVTDMDVQPDTNIVPPGFVEQGLPSYIVIVDGEMKASLDLESRAWKYMDGLARSIIEQLKKPNYRVTREETPTTITIFTQSLGLVVNSWTKMKHQLEIKTIPKMR